MPTYHTGLAMPRPLAPTHPPPRPHCFSPLPPHDAPNHAHLQSSITRDAFEELAGDFFKRAAAPLQRILQRNNLTSADVDAVELLGGGTRVPRLQVRQAGPRPHA